MHGLGRRLIRRKGSRKVEKSIMVLIHRKWKYSKVQKLLL